MIAINDLPASHFPQHIRHLDMRRDLAEVADLIELAFSAQMDPDGKEYLRQMRRLAQEQYSFRWPGDYLASGGPGIQGGLVWEEKGRVIGNLSLIPHMDSAQRVFLIANVAVHPDYRGQGIARALTQAALDQIRRYGVHSARLQVREDNQPAHNLYKHLGFRETARRTTWVSTPGKVPTSLADGTTISLCSAGDWLAAEKWLVSLYPRSITWNLPLSVSRMRPGLIYALARAIHAEHIRQWSVRQNGLLIGAAAWQAAALSADNLWLAPLPGAEAAVITALLPYVQKRAHPARPVSINYQAGQEVAAFEASGYKHQHTLIWMEHNLP
jgi:GNAT superfamily N-acetyltransferase